MSLGTTTGERARRPTLPRHETDQRQRSRGRAADLRAVREGVGLTTIAKTLDAEAAPAPRSQQGRPRAWAPSTVREILYRTLYRGQITWNRTKKRNAWGQAKRETRKSTDWFTISVPQLRIISEDLWTRVHERMEQTKAVYLRGTKGQLWGRPATGVESKYLLSGLARCETCGGSMYVKSRSHGKKRAYFYGCTSFHLRGTSVCTNSLEVPMPRSDEAVLGAIRGDVMNPDVIAATLRKALARLKPAGEAAQSRRQELERQLATVTRELERFTGALAVGGDLQTLVQAIRDKEAQRDALTTQIASLTGAERAAKVDWRTVEQQLRAKLDEWRQLLGRHVPQARQVLKKLLLGPIVFTPHREASERYYSFRASVNLGKLLAGIACAVKSRDRGDTSGSPSKPKNLRVEPDDEDRADPPKQLAAQGDATSHLECPECRPNLPPFWDFSKDVLQMETALRRTRRRWPGRPTADAAPVTPSHPEGGR